MQKNVYIVLIKLYCRLLRRKLVEKNYFICRNFSLAFCLWGKKKFCHIQYRRI